MAATEENQRLIENVFRELQTKSVDGFRYVVLKLGDGSFLHFFEAEDGASPMAGIKAFQWFQAGVRDRCLEPPQVSEAAVIGNYRMLEGIPVMWRRSLHVGSNWRIPAG